MTGRLVFVKRITRDMLRAEPEARFVFGDNVARRGLGGQAKEMRGEPNAIGVVTKWWPGLEETDFFKDDDLDAKCIAERDLFAISVALNNGRTVYFPADGIGTGLSELPTRAPKLYWHIVNFVADLARRFPGGSESVFSLPIAWVNVQKTFEIEPAYKESFAWPHLNKRFPE